MTNPLRPDQPPADQPPAGNLPAPGGSAENAAAQQPADATETPAPTPDPGQAVNGPQNQAPDTAAGDPETFPRSYVEDLRRESASYRVQAQRADEATSRLAGMAVAQATDGVLADPTDLTYDPATMADADGWPDPTKITDAAKALLDRKPHLASRRPSGNAGQGARSSPEPLDLAGLLRSRAG